MRGLKYSAVQLTVNSLHLSNVVASPPHISLSWRLLNVNPILVDESDVLFRMHITMHEIIHMSIYIVIMIAIFLDL